MKAPLIDRPSSQPALPATGGGMGWPFRRRGSESLRILPDADRFHVVWMCGESAVAHLVSDDPDVARSWYAWLAERFGTASMRIGNDLGDDRERIVREARSRRPVARHTAVIVRESPGAPPRFKVVDVVDRVVRSAAWVVDRDEGLALMDRLLESVAADA